MSNYPTTHRESKNHKYNYWKNKPVIRTDNMNKRGQIEDITKRKLYTSPDPINLNMLEWHTVDFNNNEDVEPVIDFINSNYVTNTRNKFRLYYTSESVKWALGDGSLVVIKLGSNIVGTVGYTIRDMVVEQFTEKFGEVNFLCVHKKYRSSYKNKNVNNKKKSNKKKQYLVHVLIDDAIRRIYNEGGRQGLFTTTKYIPTPTTTFRYFHRPLNYRKLHEHGHTILEGDVDSIHRRFTDKTEPMDYYHVAEKEHLKTILSLYNEYMKKFNVYVKYSLKELEHYLFNDYTRTYVMKDKTGKIVDFVSYYITYQSITGSDEKIKNANLFLYSCIKEDIQILAPNVIRLILRDTDCDVFTVTDSTDNSDFLLSNKIYPDEDSDCEDVQKAYDHKFFKGTGKSYLNFFNFGTSRMHSGQVCWTSL
jgi:glycylpeptide N-tetradecanoyltransferase